MLIKNTGPHRINLNLDRQTAEQSIKRMFNAQAEKSRIAMEKKIRKKYQKGLTLRGIFARLLSAVRKNPNTKKVMMTNEQIISEIENAPRYHVNYERLDGKTKEYTVAITERHPDHIKGYKFANGESCGIRRFNIAQINHLEMAN